jgi:hypothetical protein
LIIHGIKFECHLCGKVCTSQKSLDIHKREKHGLVKEWSMPHQHQQQQQQQLPEQPEMIPMEQHHLMQQQQQQATSSKQMVPLDLYSMTVKPEYHHQ